MRKNKKKYFTILIPLCLALIGGGSGKINTNQLIEDENAIFIDSYSFPSYSDGEDEFINHIKVDNSGMITKYGTKIITVPEEELPYVKRQLSEEELKRVKSIIIKNGMLSMENYFPGVVTEGSFSYLVFYLDDGTEYKVGGLEPSNKKFIKMDNYLSELITEEMNQEYFSKIDEYVEKVNEKLTYYTYYEQIEKYGMKDVTEEQLESVSGIAMFYDLDCAYQRYRISSETYNEHTKGYEGEGYTIFCRDESFDLYIGDDFVATIEVGKYMELYKEFIEKYQLSVTEEQLSNMDIGCFLNDSYDIFEYADYANTDSIYSYQTMTFKGAGYSINKNDGVWEIYIEKELVGTYPYVLLEDSWKEKIQEYSIEWDSKLCYNIDLRTLFFYANQIKEGDSSYTSEYYLEKEDSYVIDEYKYKYMGDGDGKYKIYVGEQYIGKFTVSD